MNKYTKTVAALVLGIAATATVASVADANWFDGHRGRCGGYMATEDPSPELQKMMEDAYNRMAPMLLEVRAKRDELTAKIYGGGDQASIDALTKQVNELQAKVNTEHVKIEQQMAKAGLPMNASGRCMFGPGPRGMMGGMHGMGPGHKGMGSGMKGMHGGMHGGGHGPAMNAPEAAPSQSLGPRNDSRDPLGGASAVEFSAEARARFTDMWGMVAFLDGGMAYEDAAADFSEEELRWGAGLGVRLYTAIGPVRLDFAVPLNPRSDDDSFQVYFSIGQSF